MKTLFHLCEDEHGDPMDAVFVDGNGFKHTVPYDTPTDIQSDFLADKIIEHLKYYGMVQVYGIRDRFGVKFDMEDAIKRAKQCLIEEEKLCVNEYIQNQLEDRVRKNYPPLPPVGRALSCVIKHKVNLLKYGIRPVGWEPPYEMDEAEAVAVSTGDTAVVQLNKRIDDMQTLIMQQQAMIMELLTGRKPGKGKAGKTDGVQEQTQEEETVGVSTGKQNVSL